jgi:hypothetical protein
LVAKGFDYPGMAVPHVGHIVVGIEVALSIGVIHPNAIATNEMQWLVIKQGRVVAQDSESALQK